MILRLVLFAALVLVAVGYLQKLDSTGAATSAVATTSGSVADTEAPVPTRRSGPVVLVADSSGHYRADGSINGRPVRFIVDTGATVIALNAETAARLNLRPKPGAYVAKLQTANGTVGAAPVILAEVRVGDALLRQVEAVILPDSALHENLLGMSFLGQLSGFESRDGQLILKP